MSGVVPLAPTPGEAVDLEGAALDEWLAERYRLDGDAWLRLNLVTGLGGQITGASGTSEGLCAGIDRPLMKLLRRSADVLLVGAASMRAGAYPLPPGIPLALATISGDLGGVRLPERFDPARVLVLHPQAAAARLAATGGSRVTSIPVDGDVAADAGLLVTALRDRGLGRVLCEGGGALASALLAAGSVTEFAQTIAPVVSSPAAPLLSGRVPPSTATLTGLLRDETDRLYARWSFSPS